jgi:hypothetical protein
MGLLPSYSSTSPVCLVFDFRIRIGSHGIWSRSRLSSKRPSRSITLAVSVVPLEVHPWLTTVDVNF